MMPPYTSLWLQILLESKGTAAWLRTGEASPVSEGEERAVRTSEGRGPAPDTSMAEMATPVSASGWWGVCHEHQLALGLSPY